MRQRGFDLGQRVRDAIAAYFEAATPDAGMDAIMLGVLATLRSIQQRRLHQRRGVGQRAF
jgi:hypothetical protein